MSHSIIVTKEENWSVATDISTGITSQGKSTEEAINNLGEALELYFEDEIAQYLAIEKKE